MRKLFAIQYTREKWTNSWTKRSEIEQVLGGDLGAYIKNLVEDYELVKRRQPLFDKPKSRNISLRIEDNFFAFWFRFIAHYHYMLEIGANEKLKEVVKRDRSRIDLEAVHGKFLAFVASTGKFKRTKPQLMALSLEDM